MLNANLPWVESPFFNEILKTKSFTSEQLSMVKEYHDNGFVVIKNLIPLALIDEVKDDCEKKAFNPDFPITTQRDERRVQDLWLVSEAAKQLACLQPILDILKI